MRWVIGDIHGMLKPLDALLAEVRRRDTAARFIFVGDYVNRGPDAPAVIERMLTLTNATFLRGNHDDIIDLILNGDCYLKDEGAIPDAIAAFEWFMSHGLQETILAYGIQSAELKDLLAHPNAEKLAQLLEVVPERHRQFFRTLRIVAEHETFFVAHAFWHPHDPDSRPDITTRLAGVSRLRQQIFWGRYTEAQIQQKKRWTRTGYFGHTPVTNYRKEADPLPIHGPQIVLLDTGAALAATGRLTAVCADNGEVVQSDRSGRIIENDKRTGS